MCGIKNACKIETVHQIKGPSTHTLTEKKMYPIKIIDFRIVLFQIFFVNLLLFLQTLFSELFLCCFCSL